MQTVKNQLHRLEGDLRAIQNGKSTLSTFLVLYLGIVKLENLEKNCQSKDKHRIHRILGEYLRELGD